MERIFRRMRELYPVSDEALGLLAGRLERRVYAPRTVIVEAGKADRRVYFIERGMTRSYSLWDGREVTSWFSLEGDVTCSSWSLYRGRAGFEYVETLEETEAYVTTTGELTELYGLHIDLANWGRVLQQENFLLLQDVHLMRLNLEARERYEMMQRLFPEVCRRANLGHIASFLGITQQSLSRIRGRREER